MTCFRASEALSRDSLTLDSFISRISFRSEGKKKTKTKNKSHLRPEKAASIPQVEKCILFKFGYVANGYIRVLKTPFEACSGTALKL